MDEVEYRKERIYKELMGNVMNVRELSKIVEVKENKLVNTLRWMAQNKYLSSERVYDNSMSRFVVLYTSVPTNPYVATIKETYDERMRREKIERDEKKKLEKELETPKSITRVVKLLDNPLPSPPRSKKSSSHKGIGSSFAMYDYY